jgi:hypothetical protein
VTAGCTGCGARETVTVDGVNGRRCADCPPRASRQHLDGLAADGVGVVSYARTLVTLPPGGYRRGLAEHMVDLGRADAAFAYLTGWMAHEIGARFDRATARLVGSR